MTWRVVTISGQICSDEHFLQKVEAVTPLDKLPPPSARPSVGGWGPTCSRPKSPRGMRIPHGGHLYHVGTHKSGVIYIYTYQVLPSTNVWLEGRSSTPPKKYWNWSPVISHLWRRGMPSWAPHAVLRDIRNMFWILLHICTNLLQSEKHHNSAGRDDFPLKTSKN